MAWLISLRVLLSVSANAVQKRLLLDRAGVYHTWILTYLLILGPAAAFAALAGPHSSPAFWRDILLGGGLDAIGNLLMVAALRITDISVFGPLNALRPILALIFGWVFLSETPTALGLAGVGITVAGGVILFSDIEGRAQRNWRQITKAISLRVGGLALGVIGAVFLKKSSLVSTAEMTVAAWLVCGLTVLFTAAALHRPGDLRTLGSTARSHLAWLTLHAAVFGVMQWLTIRIFQETLLAYSFVYFQLAMVLQVFVGKMFFNERAFARRLIASVVMAAGSVLILWKG